MNIALTGSSGALGSRLLGDLRKMGHNVLCISSSFSSSKENIYSYQEILSQSIKFQADYFLHLATFNSDLSEAQVALEVSLTNTAIKCMENLGCKNFIFFSSVKVYGENSFNSKKFTEDSSQLPQSLYGLAKLECEKVILQNAELKHFNYLIFRLAPVLIHSSKSNLGIIFRIIQMGIPLPTFKIGDSNKRSFLSYNFLSLVLKITFDDLKRVNNDIFNLSDSIPVSTNALFGKLAKDVNKKLRIIYLPNFLFRAMMKVNRLQLILAKLFGNFYIPNDKLKTKFNIPENH